MRTPSSASQGDNLALGIGLMILGMAFLNAMDAVSKYLTADHSEIQVTWARYTFHLLPLLLFAGPRRIREMATTRHLGMQIARSAALALSATCIIAAFAIMQLAEAIAISFIAPLIMVGISARFLGEHVDIHRWLAVAIGFGGMLVIVWPSGDVIDAGALLVITAALLWAVGLTLTRSLRGDDAWTTLFYTAFIGSLMLGVAVPFFWSWPTTSGWGLMLAMGMLGGIAHTLIIFAFQRAGASQLAPFNYTLLLWAMLYGWLIFGELPGTRALIGAAIIIGAGLYAWNRERLHAA